MVHLSMAAVAIAAQAFLSSVVHAAISCDTVEKGYECNPYLTHHWGQYSPYFSLESENPPGVSAEVPPQCTIDFVNLLSRHGARFPTASKSSTYNATIIALKKSVTSYPGIYAFLKDFTYDLGSDILTSFGQQQLVNSGIQFYNRYPELSRKNAPFVRSDASARVVQSAKNWTQAFHQIKLANPLATSNDSYPYPILSLSDATNFNNTLSVSTCNQFENGWEANTPTAAQATFANTFVPAIAARLNADLKGANLTVTQTINLMDLCPFETVNSNTGKISDFCSLFTDIEWQKYDYYQTLGKWYGNGAGNLLGPTQGVGYVAELLARLTGSPITTQNGALNLTLDQSNSTFPLNKAIYADFSHDNEMTSIFTALGLYNATVALGVSNTTATAARGLAGYSAAWTVPFAARLYFEKMTCAGVNESLVRAVVDDRVVPLVGCGADELGRCTLSKFVESQGFARGGGLWNLC